MADPLFVTDGAWGTGVHRVLTAAEIDANVYALLARIVAMESDPPTPIEISNIAVVGNQLKVFLANGDEYGPFPIPTAMFHYRSEGWANSTQYYAFDVISIADIGVFFVQFDHITPDAPAEFDPNAVDPDTSEPLYFQTFGVTASGGSGSVSDEYPAIIHSAFGGL